MDQAVPFSSCPDCRFCNFNSFPQHKPRTANARGEDPTAAEKSFLTFDSSSQSNLEASSSEEQVNEYDQTEHFSAEELKNTKKIAVQFVTAIHTYNADKPRGYLEQAKPYLTDALYEKMNKNGRREVSNDHI